MTPVAWLERHYDMSNRMRRLAVDPAQHLFGLKDDHDNCACEETDEPSSWASAVWRPAPAEMAAAFDREPAATTRGESR